MSGHEERVHKRFSPSQAERFFACHGSTNLLARVSVREESIWAKEGTDAHAILEHALRNGFRRAKDAHEDSDLWMFPLNTFDNFFYYSVQIALDYVYAILDEHPDAQMSLEQVVNVPCPSAPGEADGYNDIQIWIPSIKTLYIIDFKHGAGITKAAFGNKQLLQYGAGVVYGMAEKPEQTILVIVQPRAYHEDGATREYEVTEFDLMNYLDLMDQAVAASLQPDAPLSPDDNGKTTDHCRFCDAKTVCPAREAQALSVINKSFKTVRDVKAPEFPLISELDIDRLAYIRMYGPMLVKWVEDVNDHILELAKAGHHIPGTKVVEAKAMRKWFGDPDELATRLSALTGRPIEEVVTRKLINITDAEKLVVEAFKNRVGRGKKNLAAEQAKKTFAYFTLKQSSGALVLADENDPRQAVNRTSGFSQIVAATGQLQITGDTE